MPPVTGWFAAACSSVNGAEQGFFPPFTVSHMEDQSYRQVGGCVAGAGLPVKDSVVCCAEGKWTLIEVISLGRTWLSGWRRMLIVPADVGLTGWLGQWPPAPCPLPLNIFCK